MFISVGSKVHSWIFPHERHPECAKVAHRSTAKVATAVLALELTKCHEKVLLSYIPKVANMIFALESSVIVENVLVARAETTHLPSLIRITSHDDRPTATPPPFLWSKCNAFGK